VGKTYQSMPVKDKQGVFQYLYCLCYVHKGGGHAYIGSPQQMIKGCHLLLACFQGCLIGKEIHGGQMLKAFLAQGTVLYFLKDRKESQVLNTLLVHAFPYFYIVRGSDRSFQSIQGL